METKEDRSYGVIPYVKDERGFRFFLIHQFSSVRGDSYWVFPKGHAEEGESEVETASRELMEETQLRLESLDDEHLFVIEYNFIYEGVRIEKSVTYFLGFALSEEYVLKEDEVKEGGWFTYEEARKKITHENSKRLLDEVFHYLKTRITE